jgi:hypothetical protein
VKSIFGLVEGIYRLRGTHGDKIPYTAEEIDFLVAYIAAEKVWYVIPVNCVPASAVLAFYPSGRERGSGRLEAFREAWHLMAPGADLPQPRMPSHARSRNLHCSVSLSRSDLRCRGLKSCPQWLKTRSRFLQLAARLKSFGTTSKSATGALKRRGFKPRRTSFPRSCGTARKPCPFKTLNAGSFTQLLQSCHSRQRMTSAAEVALAGATSTNATRMD